MILYLLARNFFTTLSSLFVQFSFLIDFYNNINNFTDWLRGLNDGLNAFSFAFFFIPTTAFHILISVVFVLIGFNLVMAIARFIF